jgi:hypothetical protein
MFRVLDRAGKARLMSLEESVGAPLERRADACDTAA